MEHAKKMVLVPAEEAGRWREPMTGGGTATPVADQKTVQTPGDPVSRLDAELTDILHSKKYPDDATKWKEYLQVLQRYLYLIDARNGPKDSFISSSSSSSSSPLSSSTTTTAAAAGATTTTTTPSTDDQQFQPENENFSPTIIVNSVPEIYRRQARALTSYLRNSPSASQRITWDKEGRVTVDGILIPDSNIVDLVNDAVRSRKNFKANGRIEFIKSLRAISVPRTFIGNDLLWNIGNTPISRKRQRKNRDDSGQGDYYDGDDDEENNENQHLVTTVASGSTTSTETVKHAVKRRKKKDIETPRKYTRWLKL